MKKFLFLLFMVLVSLNVLTGCNKEISISIDDSEKDITLSVGESKSIELVMKKGDTLVLTSSQPNVAIIESTTSNSVIQITALSEGKSVMTVGVESNDNLVTINVTVIKQEPVEVKIVGPNMLVLKESIQLKGTVLPENADQDLTWSSSNEKIATVDASGMVNTHKFGEVIITATSTKTSIKNQITIQVILPDPTGLNLIGDKNVEVNHTVTYTAIIEPLQAGQGVTWKVSNEALASISPEGVLTAKGIGNVKVIAISKADESKRKELEITIFEVPQTIEIEGSESLNIGESAKYSVSVTPELSSLEVTWSVSDTSIADITEDGILTPIKSGTVKVVATSNFLEAIKGEFEVIIFATPTRVSFRGPELFIIGGTGTVFAQLDGDNGQIVDQTYVTFTSDNPSVVSVDELKGVVTAVSVGTATITITSKADNTKKDSALITVQDVDGVYDVSTILITKEYSNKVSFYSSVDYSTHILGINAFTTLDEALLRVSEGGRVIFLEGIYSEEGNITKNNLTISGIGEAIITGVININKDIDGLTITNLHFTGRGSVAGSPEGGITNFMFQGNHVYDPKADQLSVLCFPVGSDELFNSNFIIRDNVFEVINSMEIDNRYIRGGNLVGLTLENNQFVGLQGQYTDAVRLGGTGNNVSESSANGVGVGGEVIVRNNEFINMGQRALWIIRYTATSIIIENNLIDYAGDENYGGGIHIDSWAGEVNTNIKVRYNTFKNIKGFFGVRINNKNVVFDSTWEAAVTFNKFIYVPNNTKYIEGYSIEKLIEGSNNYYQELSEEAFAGVKNYTQAFETEADYDLSSILDQGDNIYGVAVSSDSFEEHANIAYKDTTTIIGGLNWIIKELYLNPDLNDKANTTEFQGNKMIRLRGANIASMELTEFYNGITTFAFDGKYYNGLHSDTIMKVSKLIEGGAWVEVATIALTDTYGTKYVEINETGNVKIRIDVTTHSANIDNLIIYQSKELFITNYKNN